MARDVLAMASSRFFLRNAKYAGIKKPTLVHTNPQKTICFRPIHVGEMSTDQEARVLGEGSFGCVLKPPVACAKEPKLFAVKRLQRTQNVGKVFYDKKDYEVEVKASQKVVNIDPRGKHILGPTSHCETTFGKVSDHPSAYECKNVRERIFLNPSTPMYQITMPFGGQRYDKFLKNGTTRFDDFIQQIIHVLEGVQKLQRHQTCHQDLKASNLLINRDGTVMIIDYSLMMSFDEIYSKKNLRRLHHSYFPYPPEYKIFYLLDQKICADECAVALRQVMKNLEHYGNRRKQIFERIHGGEDEIKRFVATLYEYLRKLLNKGSHAQLINLAKKVDVYSVGAIMMDVDGYILKHGVSKTKLSKYDDAVRSMTMIDPRKRDTVAVALKKLRAIL